MFWPAMFHREILARLLALNAECTARERWAGLMPVLRDRTHADAMETP
jgi:hypothetical protein